MENNNHHRSVIDQEFVGAGQKEGLEIWRIDHFKVTRIPVKFHGKINHLKNTIYSFSCILTSFILYLNP